MFKAGAASLGSVLIASHLVVLAALIVLTMSDRFTIDELFSAGAIITPLFVTYTVPTLRWMLNEEGGEAGASVTRRALNTAWLIALAYVTIIMTAILWKAFGSLGMSNLVKMIGLVEASFAAYLGLIVQKLFAATAPVAAPAPSAPAAEQRQ
ncbi:MAG TPA: hypothetical protein VJS15_07495 [Allosphingosinicella sp.]|nr:hypothetical protein [Allosphingosinicella sp.]